MNADRVMLFLESEVIYEKASKKGRKPKDYDAESELIKKWESKSAEEQQQNDHSVSDLEEEPEDGPQWRSNQISKGVKTIEGYVSALCNLHKYQKEVMGILSQTYPRTDMLKKLLRSIRTQKHRTKQQEKEDRGKGKSSFLMSGWREHN